MDTSMPGEVSAEECYEIRMQIAKEIMGGKYEFVLTTHIDKKYFHNHPIFNTVCFFRHNPTSASSTRYGEAVAS